MKVCSKCSGGLRGPEDDFCANCKVDALEERVEKLEIHEMLSCPICSENARKGYYEKKDKCPRHGLDES